MDCFPSKNTGTGDSLARGEPMNVLMTLVGGKPIYQREDFRPSVTIRPMTVWVIPQFGDKKLFPYLKAE